MTDLTRAERCTTHHYACACREAKIKRLVEAVEAYIGFPCIFTAEVLHSALADVKGMMEGE